MLRKYRVLFLIVAALVMIALWYAFRPEKLFVNHKVDEPPPASMLRPNPTLLPSPAPDALAA